MYLPLDLPKTNLSKYVVLIQGLHIMEECVSHLGMLLKAIPLISTVPKILLASSCSL